VRPQLLKPLKAKQWHNWAASLDSDQSNPSLTELYRCKDEVNPPKNGYKFTNQPLKDLGMKFTPVHEYLHEAVRSLQDKGFIRKPSDTKVQLQPTALYINHLDIQSLHMRDLCSSNISKFQISGAKKHRNYNPHKRNTWTLMDNTDNTYCIFLFRYHTSMASLSVSFWFALLTRYHTSSGPNSTKNLLLQVLPSRSAPPQNSIVPMFMSKLWHVSGQSNSAVHRLQHGSSIHSVVF
jgi:hypothetical protein